MNDKQLVNPCILPNTTLFVISVGYNRESSSSHSWLYHKPPSSHLQPGVTGYTNLLSSSTSTFSCLILAFHLQSHLAIITCAHVQMGKLKPGFFNFKHFFGLLFILTSRNLMYAFFLTTKRDKYQLNIYYNHGLNKIFPGRFLAVSLHISILLYIRISHSRGQVSRFQLWRPFRNQTQKLTNCWLQNL